MWYFSVVFAKRTPATPEKVSVAVNHRLNVPGFRTTHVPAPFDYSGPPPRLADGSVDPQIGFRFEVSEGFLEAITVEFDILPGRGFDNAVVGPHVIRVKEFIPESGK